ncbi:hypothetical protein [Thermococcus alcaliphilus]|uniref:hypothetical protein n=1 Tax=Thermococcus alcaliphilus TaxID=139207 RepID=UPI002090B286|nr:hypothetical protein [Thermococcus alcaliphilus]MCO6041243.1 hypothetical protein [Thermococcus alcaliphilus]
MVKLGATAFILVGNRPYLTPGLPNPGYLLVLYENNMPAWELIPLYPYLEKNLGKRSVIWIPSIENMLEDALLMVGIYVTKDPELIKMAEKVFGRNFKAERIEIGGNPEVEKLREIARRNLQRYDIGLLIIPLKDSTIIRQLDYLKRYGRLWYSIHIRNEKLSSPLEDWSED